MSWNIDELKKSYQAAPIGNKAKSPIQNFTPLKQMCMLHLILYFFVFFIIFPHLESRNELWKQLTTQVKKRITLN